MIRALNHAVLYVRDAARTREFYEEVLGFRTLMVDARRRLLPGAGLDQRPRPRHFPIGSGARPSSAGRSTVGLYHLAWEVDTLAELDRIRRSAHRGRRARRRVRPRHHQGLYAQDPDGIEFEVCWLLAGRLLDRRRPRRRRHPRLGHLDLAAEIARFGADTPGATSVPA